MRLFHDTILFAQGRLADETGVFLEIRRNRPIWRPGRVLDPGHHTRKQSARNFRIEPENCAMV